MKINKLNFGTAGIPISTEHPNTLTGIEQVKKLKLDAMELEFVRSINIKEEKAPEVKKVAKENDVVLTNHAPYFINLNAKEKAKLNASKHRIYQSAKIAFLCGAYSVCFHPGFYMKEDKVKVYEKIKKELKEVVKKLKDDNIDIWVRPELTGKPSAFGDLDEILKLSKEIDNVMPCIDFAHMHARSNKNNTLKEFKEILTKVEKHLGKKGLKNMHIHLSGINYTEKGERNHLNLRDSDMNYKDLLKVWKTFNISGVVISESPNIEKDAMMLKELYYGKKI